MPILENNIFHSWTDLKSLASSKEIPIQYRANSQLYEIFIFDSGMIHYTHIWFLGKEPFGVDVSQNTNDRIDFETNFIPIANKKITLPSKIVNSDGSKTVEVIDVGGINRLQVEASFVDNGPSGNVVITDPVIPTQQALVDASGRLQVSAPSPTAPPASTSITQTIDGIVGNNDSINSFYTITSGDTLTIQRLLATGHAANNGWDMEIYSDPLGVGAAGSAVQGSWVLLGYINIPATGGSDFSDLNAELLGDGTARVVLRRHRLGGGGSKRGFIQFVGFEI